MNELHNARLTSAEIASLWTSYVMDSMSVCGLKYFKEKAEDPQIRPILEFGLQLAETQMKKVKQIFINENIPIPHGFTDADVDPTAPRLFSDSFALQYVVHMAKFVVSGYSISLSSSVRSDVTGFYSNCVINAMELLSRSRNVALEKGLYVRPPSIPYPDKVDFVHKQSFLGNWFGDQRPLLAIEIGNLDFNIKRNTIGKALIMGFSQVAADKEVRKFMEKGRDIAADHIEAFGALLTKEHLPVPMTWDAEVTASKVSPFSDRLIMFHITTLIASGIGEYGAAISVSPRIDIASLYVRLTAEIMKYADDGAKIMINNGWMEQPPQAVDREALAKA
jgi:hypothetical protein